MRSKHNSSLVDYDAASAVEISFYRNVWFGAQIIPWLIVGGGILSGKLKDIWSIFHINDANPFTLSFLGMSIAIAWGGAWWVFSGGARKVVDLRLMEQFGYRGRNYNERGVKIIAGMGVFAPIFFVVGCLFADNDGGPIFRAVQMPASSVSADGYGVVYDLTQTGFSNWWFPAFGLIFVAVGSVLVYFRKDLPVKGPVFMQRAFPFIFLGFSIFWTLLAFSGPFLSYRQIVHAIAEDRAKVVEGEVTDFVPMPAAGHSMEHFCVQQVCFSYSDFVVGGGFNNTASHGGPIHAGLPVRVTYVDTEIVKLETRPGENKESAGVESQAEKQYNSIFSMKETFQNITTAAGIHVALDDCTSINKVNSDSTPIARWYECPVPESSRPRLRSEFLKQGWEPEKILDGAMSKFRKSDQTASLYCVFNASTCKLHLEYSAQRK